MLVLTRREGQSVLIGDDIVVTIAAIRGDKVRLGITAPVEIAVDREEIRQRPDYRPDYRRIDDEVE